MNRVLSKIVLTIVALLAASGINAQSQEPFWLGADISGTTELEARGIQLTNAAGEPRENTELMKELGLNAVRLRVWVEPTDGLCNGDDVLRMALRAKALGMALMIDFHYSDWWADPGKQNIPKSWKGLSYGEMCDALANHTREVLRKLKNNGIDRFSISMSRDFFDERTLNKLDRTIENKGELFKMAFKTDDLSYKVTDDRVIFDWFPFSGESGEGLAYSSFIDLLTKSLKEQKRVNASKAQTENPKFAMRVYLIKLGMVGDEYKQTRKILLRNLEGSSAFRKGVPHNEDTE